jgi:hypothetical protein
MVVTSTALPATGQWNHEPLGLTGSTWQPAKVGLIGALPRLGEGPSGALRRAQVRAPVIVMLKRPPYLADCNSFRFAATALNLMRNVPICSSRACCSAPGGSLRAVSKSLAAIFSRSCILSPLHFAMQNTAGFGEALSVRYRTPPLICRTAGKLSKCYASHGDLNSRRCAPARPPAPSSQTLAGLAKAAAMICGD